MMKKIKYIAFAIVLIVTGAFGYVVSKIYTDEAKQNEVREFRALAFKGYTLVNLGKDEEAIEAYEKAVAIYDKDPRSLSDLAMLYRKRGELEKARKYYLKAFDAGQDRYHYLYNASLVQYMLGEYEEVIENVERLLHIDGNRLKYYKLLTAAAYAKGDKKRAFGYYRVLDERGGDTEDEFLQAVRSEYEALEEKPQSLEVVYRYQLIDDEAELEVLMHEYEREGYDIKALRTAQKILLSNESHDGANMMAAELFSKHNEFNEAYYYVSKINNHNARSLKILGASLQNRGEYKEAIEAYERSYAKEPSNDLLRAMAVCAWRDKDEQKMFHYLAKLKAADPLLATKLIYAMGIESGVENSFFDKLIYFAKVEFYKGYCKIVGCEQT